MAHLVIVTHHTTAKMKNSKQGGGDEEPKIQITLIITGETYPFLHGARIMTDTDSFIMVFILFYFRETFLLTSSKRFDAFQQLR